MDTDKVTAGGRLLVTEKAGELKILDVTDGTILDVSRVPEVAYAGQGGFGDVVLHPDFDSVRGLPSVTDISGSVPVNVSRALRHRTWSRTSARSSASIVGGLSSQSIRRIEFNDDDSAEEAEFFDMGMRVRGLAQGPDGAIWALEGGSRGGNGRLYKLTARQ